MKNKTKLIQFININKIGGVGPFERSLGANLIKAGTNRTETNKIIPSQQNSEFSATRCHNNEKEKRIYFKKDP